MFLLLTLIKTYLASFCSVSVVEFEVVYVSGEVISLNKKWSFPLRIFSVNVTADLVTYTEEILIGKLHFLCSVCSESCNRIISTERKWLIERLGRLLKNKSFWMGVCLDWALNRTWVLFKKLNNENNEKCQTSNFFAKTITFLRKFLPKLIIKILLFLLFKLARSFNWIFKTDVGVYSDLGDYKKFFLKSWCLIGHYGRRI